MENFTSDKSISILDSVIKWKETYELSFELAEISHILLLRLADFCKERNIPLFNEKGTRNLIDRAGIIFNQIMEINSPNYKPHDLLIRRNLTEPKSDDKFTESETRLYVVGIKCLKCGKPET